MAAAEFHRMRLPSSLQLPVPGNYTQLMAAESLRLLLASLTQKLQLPENTLGTATFCAAGSFAQGTTGVEVRERIKGSAERQMGNPPLTRGVLGLVVWGIFLAA